MKQFSTAWEGSKNPRKQRKYRYQAPLHIRHRFLAAHLSKELRKKYAKRSLSAHTGDKVRVMAGQFRKREGKVSRIDARRERVFIEGIERTKKDGTKLPVPFHPSNLLLLELVLEDKKRRGAIERKGKKEEKPK